MEDRDLFMAKHIMDNCCYSVVACLGNDIHKTLAIGIYPNNCAVYCPPDDYSIAEYGYTYCPTEELFTLCESLLKDNNGV